MKPNKIIMLTASLLVAGLGLSANAHADAYAVSINHATNGYLDVWQNNAGTACSLINSGIGGVGDCPIGTVIVNYASAPANTSGAGYTFGPLGSPLNPGPSAADGPSFGLVDVPEQEYGTAQGPNQFSPVGVQNYNYTRGDSVLSSEQSTIPAVPISPTTTFPALTLNTYIDAQNIAESNVIGNNTATADGQVGSGTLMTINVSLANPGQIAFSFQAEPFMQVYLSPDAAIGSVAKAVLAASITITPAAGGAPLFVWSPDGILGSGISGGTEVSDTYSLNTNTLRLTPGTNTYDPGCIGCVGTYTAFSNLLPAGEYTLSLAMSEHSEVTSVAESVPEPATLAMLGMGLTGLGFTRRRLRRKA